MRGSVNVRRISLLAAVTLTAVALCPPAGRAAAACDRVVSPGSGVVRALVGSLSAGQVGCLHGGDYREDVTIDRGGSAGAPIVLQSYPGERATLFGRLVISQGADYITVRDLNLDGATAP